MKGFIVQSSAKTINDQTYIQLFGRLENGKSFGSIHKFEPHFFIAEKDLKKIKPLLSKFSNSPTDLTNFQGEKVVKISAETQTDLNKLSKAIHKKEVNTYEADLKPVNKFMIDNDLLGPIEIDTKNSDTLPNDKVDFFYEDPKILPSIQKPNLKVASIDIETDKKGNDLYCIGIFSKNYKKCFLLSSEDKQIPNTINCSTENELLTKFKAELIALDPDIITGWNVIDFDLAFLRKKFEKNKIPFDIGRDNSNPRIKIESNFFRSSTAEIKGRQVLDALNLIRDPFIKEAPSIKEKKFTSYTLENVSQEILKDGKLLTGKARHDEITELFHKNKKKLVEYNLKDCELVYEILEKTKIVDLATERASLTGSPLNKITASIIAFDSLYIREAHKRGLVSPTTHYIQKPERIQGGFVMESQPGIFHNLLVLDFKSLYPSIIKTFNIDPASFLTLKTKNAITAPNGAQFKNTDGILPQIIETLHKAREKAKKEKRELSSYAIKIIMNSFFGVLASPNCRYFSLDMANAITHFGQHLIKLTASEIQSQTNYHVIYSDTDSVFVETNLNKKEAKKLGQEIQEKINSFYNKHVKEHYNRKSYLELEFEKLYLAFMMPPVRGSNVASKKRYAGLLEKNGKEEIQVVGLEAIRGDWTEAAQDFQIKLLDKIFHKQEFIPFIRNYVKKIQSGDLDEKLIYKKSLTKPLDQYTKTTPPHVKAARLLPKLDSKIVQYVMTEAGPEPIQKQKHKLDYKHYIDKQIKPIANTLLFFFEKDFDDIIATSKQMKLF